MELLKETSKAKDVDVAHLVKFVQDEFNFLG